MGTLVWKWNICEWQNIVYLLSSGRMESLGCSCKPKCLSSEMSFFSTLFGKKKQTKNYLCVFISWTAQGLFYQKSCRWQEWIILVLTNEPSQNQCWQSKEFRRQGWRWGFSQELWEMESSGWLKQEVMTLLRGPIMSFVPQRLVSDWELNWNWHLKGVTK